jgi:hypothetical protein
MNKSDIIKTFIFDPQYYEYKKKDYYEEFLKIFNNNNLYLYINIYGTRYYKTKQIKQNYIIFSYYHCYDNNSIYTKVKNYDNTKIDIINGYNSAIYNFDVKINTNFITKKIEKDIYIIYYHKKNIIKDGYYKVIRRHNSKYNTYKYYKTYYINYYIIIYKNNLYYYTNIRWNTIFCNFSRNFMLFI